MPIHDWTRVGAGTWHAFHLSWIAELQEALNDGRMPADYYAQAEQITGDIEPDVLTLQEIGAEDLETESAEIGGVAVATAPPPVRVTQEVECEYVPKNRTLVIRHASGDRIVALLELVSPGNKSSQLAFRQFIEKATAAIDHGYHLLVVDLFPGGPRDPHGIHAAIWSEFHDRPFVSPTNEPLTLVAYCAGKLPRAYVEPTAVGRPLIDMPLFLNRTHYVNVPLEATYQAAYRGVPKRWRDVLEGTRSN